MAVVYAPNVIEIAVIGTYGNRPSVNVWHMGYDVDLGDTQLVAVVEDFRNNWQDDMMDALTNGYTLERFEWRSLDPGNSAVGIVQPDPGKPLVGAIAEVGAPANVAYLLNKTTANRPRGRRDGRAFLSGVRETNVNDAGLIDSGFLATLNGYAAAFYNGISDTGTFTDLERWPAVLETTPASRAPGPQSVTISSRRVTSLSFDSRVATQRDRLR